MTTLALGLLLLPSAQDPSTTALTSGGLVWTYRADSFLPQIALGDRGGQLLALTDDDELLLLSSFDANPPAPLWSSPDVHWSEYRDDPPIVAAADRDVYLFADPRDIETVYGVITLKKYRSGSHIPEWHYAFSPQQFMVNVSYDVSRDGETIVSSYNDEWQMAMVIRVHDPATGTPTRTFAFPYVADPGFEFDLSPDGSVAAASIGLSDSVVFEVDTGRPLASIQERFTFRHALSEHGRVLVTRGYWYQDGGFRVRVFRRTPGGYALAFEIPTIYDIQPRQAAVSDDGSTVVAVWSDSGMPKRSIVRAYDVATGTMTMEHVDVSLTGYIEPWRLAIDADGSRFVVGLYGSGAGSVPELAVYSRDSDQPIREHPNLGWVYDVEISPDGKRYAASRSLDNPPGWSPAVIEMYELGGEDLVVRGRPVIGETITFELHGAPGARAALLRSFALAPTPIDLPGVGTLRLDPATIASTPMGIVPPSGVATHSTVVSTIPGMIGRTLYYQGLTSSPRTLTDDFVQLTIVP